MCREPRPIPLAESWCYELQFPRDPRGPRVARVALRAILSGHGLEELAERAELLSCELVTNAVRHTAGPAAVSLRWLHPVLRVSVWDTSPTLPTLPDTSPSPDAFGGRGLPLVEAMADRWNCLSLGNGPWGPLGKITWFELFLSDEKPPTAIARPAA